MSVSTTFWRFNFADRWLSSPARWGLLGLILLAWLGVALLALWPMVLVLALILADARQRTEIDVSQRAVKVGYPLAPWRAARTFLIDDYDWVGLERVDRALSGSWFRRRDSEGKEDWSLQLEGPKVEPLVLQRFSEQTSVSFELRLEREAKSIADRLELGYRKRADGQVIEQEAGTLHESLRQRAERTGVVPDIPEGEGKPDPSQPPGRIRVSTHDDVLELTFPAVDSSTDHAIAIGGVVTVVGFAALCIMGKDAPQGNNAPGQPAPIWASPWASYWPVIFLVWPIITTVVYYTMASIVDRVRIAPEELSWNRTGALGWVSQSRSIAAEDLQQVEIAEPVETAFWEDDRKEAVIVRGEHNCFHFGSCLSAVEKRWLRDLVVYLMSV